MSSRRKGNKRSATPKTFENHPDIPSDGEDDNKPVNEEKILAGSDEEDDVYQSDEESSEVEGSDSEGSIHSEEAEDSEPPKTKVTPRAPRGRPAKSAIPTKKATPAPRTSRGTTKTATSHSRKKTTDEEEEPGKRYFKILADKISPESGSLNVNPDDLSTGGGRYTGKNPMQAAKKAFTRICRVANNGGECCYVFYIQETTQSSPKKSFPYRGIRTVLENCIRKSLCKEKTLSPLLKT